MRVHRSLVRSAEKEICAAGGAGRVAGRRRHHVHFIIAAAVRASEGVIVERGPLLRAVIGRVVAARRVNGSAKRPSNPGSTVRNNEKAAGQRMAACIRRHRRMRCSARRRLKGGLRHQRK